MGAGARRVTRALHDGTRLARIFHRLALLAALLLAGASIVSCGGPRNQAASYPAPALQLVDIAIEQPGGVALTQHHQGGAVFIAGREGERYNIRVTNNSPSRVEAVVTVDGRDVITGQLGDYKRQRGYVIGPRSSVLIEGFRQSYDHVAAFRFSSVQASYSGRQGTPQHVGVIGVAVFSEKPPKRPRANNPIAVGPAPPSSSPQPEPAPFAGGRLDEASRGPAPGASMDAEGEADAAMFDDGAGAAPASAPMAEEAPTEKRSADAGDRGFAPPPAPQNELGTEYGETMSSKVHDVEFRRRSKRTPDEIIAIFYDSERGLQSRGIQVSPGVAPRPVSPSGTPLSGTSLD